ncbi:hypothetical protein BST81_12195 [Leptolyngbya sp. 'hensonii']|nr:hypothetical protein BST81_12195 [Leptolyngbya sp. 'hensonii']
MEISQHLTIRKAEDCFGNKSYRFTEGLQKTQKLQQLFKVREDKLNRDGGNQAIGLDNSAA